MGSLSPMGGLAGMGAMGGLASMGAMGMLPPPAKRPRGRPPKNPVSQYQQMFSQASPLMMHQDAPQYSTALTHHPAPPAPHPLLGPVASIGECILRPIN